MGETGHPIILRLGWEGDPPCQRVRRTPEGLRAAKAYAASTYTEPLFKSDVTQAFLDAADKERIPLASTEWRRFLPPSEEG